MGTSSTTTATITTTATTTTTTTTTTTAKTTSTTTTSRPITTSSLTTTRTSFIITSSPTTKDPVVDGRPTITQPQNTSLTQGQNLIKSCPKFLLGSEEFLFSNSTVYVPAYDKTYIEGEYLLSEDSVYVCQPPDIFSGTEKFSPVMGYVTFACLGVSLVCLVVHLVISCIAPELQNLSGKNLFSLSLALIGAYASFLANMFTND